MILIYSLLLLCVEFAQMKVAKKWSHYFGQSKNWTDLLAILLTFVIALVSIFSEDFHKKWVPSLIFFVALLTCFQLLTNMAECLPNNDIVQTEKYINMFFQVAKRYCLIVFGFLPFMMMFAFCFQG